MTSISFYKTINVLLSLTNWNYHWHLMSISVGNKLREDIKFNSKEFGILWLPVISNTDWWTTKWVQINDAVYFQSNGSDYIMLSLSKIILWYSASHSAEEVYSARVPSLTVGGGSCWSLHILLAALLTQNTLMTSPLSLPSHTVKSSMFPCGP